MNNIVEINLDDCKTRAEAYELIKDKTKNELKEIAKNHGYYIELKCRRDLMIQRLIEWTVGSTLKSKAIAEIKLK